MFNTDAEVLRWYERQPRTLSKDFSSSISWHEIKDYPLNPAFIPVLLYMRDVEYFTDMYYRELLRTPTGKDPVIKKFMERWTIEELEHAELLDRFLNEAGVTTSKQWKAEARSRIPRSYRMQSYLVDQTVKIFGKYFHAAHMVWGAINEITTLQGYRRLSELAGHPVLKKLLSGVMHEESIHSTFYWNIARLKLEQSKFSQDLARFILGRFWAPVGQGAKPQTETNYVITTLFSGTSGMDVFNKTVTSRVDKLPGFAGFTAVSEKLGAIVQPRLPDTEQSTSLIYSLR